jgi:recombination protein RecR
MRGSNVGAASALDRLIRELAGLPSIGPRSARRVALYLIEQNKSKMTALAEALNDAATNIAACNTCGNLDDINPCRICCDIGRDERTICVVASVSDLWAIERTGVFRGSYHVLGGLLSALSGIRPEHLRIESLLARASARPGCEVILALSATVDGQATAHVVAEKLAGSGAKISKLAHGVPVGGELDYLDEGTIMTALKSRA